MNYKDFEEKVTNFLDAKGEKGLTASVRITFRDEIIYRRFLGAADREHNIPIDKDTVFSFYSLSKPFCAIGLLLLKDKGLVDVDKHPGEYVPEMRLFDERLTIRHMLHHISGLPDFELMKEFRDQHLEYHPEQIREHMEQISHFPMCFVPGTDGMYANINFVGCALIIENVTGATYEEYMRKNVFAPLNMTTARVDRQDLRLPNRAIGYELEEGKPIPIAPARAWMLGAGDIVGTVDDVYRLNHAIKHQLLLRPETWKDVLTPSPINNMGMGCTVNLWNGRKKRILHNGGHTGFRTLHIQMPEDDLDIIMLSNSGFCDVRYDFMKTTLPAFYGMMDSANENIAMDKGYIPGRI